MSKFASSSVLLLSLAMVAAGAIIPQIAILSFLSGIARIISIAGAVLLAIFLIASFGLKGILRFILYAQAQSSSHGTGFPHRQNPMRRFRFPKRYCRRLQAFC